MTRPLGRQVEQRRFEQAQLQAAFETGGVAGEARKALFDAAAEQRLADYFGQVKEAAAARERLVRFLALDGARLGFELPQQLPDLPAAPAEPKDAEQTAMTTRLDVLMAKHAPESTARSLGLTRTTRFINVLDVGYQNQSNAGEPR